MYRPTILLLLTSAANITFAEPCSDIVDDEKRLSCFDAKQACARILSDSDRLACFDAVYPVVSAREPTVAVEPEAGSDPEPKAGAESVATTAAEVGTEKNDEFGKRWQNDDEPVQFIEAEIVELKSDPFKVDYFRLDNGQVWREISDSRVRFKVGQKVTITEGIMGSFDLQTEGTSQYVKVRRLK